MPPPKTNTNHTNANKSVFTPLGASNHSTSVRESHDYYATDPRATELLLGVERFSPTIWEPACGEGHIAKVLEQAGHSVISTDLIYRGYGNQEPLDFMLYDGDAFDGDIVTNPPYTAGAEFAEKAIETITDGHKVAMFLKVQFLEGQKRRKFFDKYPPRTVYVLSKRMKCAKNGDFNSIGSSAVAYAWFVWQKGFAGRPEIQWIN